MANANGKITAPVTASDPYAVMGLQVYNGTYDIGYACTNTHNKINPHSYFKPIRHTSVAPVTMTNALYRASTKLRTYKIGDAVPTATNLIYYPPVHTCNWSRLSDFDNYIHSEYSAKVDLSSIPSVWNYDNFNQYLGISTGSNLNLFNILLAEYFSGYWDNALLIIAKKGNVTRYFITARESFSLWRIHAHISYAYDTFVLLKSMGIKDYTCSAYAIAIPYTHLDIERAFHEVTPSQNYTYVLYPEVGDVKPFKIGFTITNPGPREFYNAAIQQGGQGIDNAFIPGTLPVHCIVRRGASEVLYRTPVNTTWADLENGYFTSGNFKINDNPATDGLYIGMQIGYHNGQRPSIAACSGTYRFDDGQGVLMVDWNYYPFSSSYQGGLTDAYVKIYYQDLDIRPEN